MNEAARLISKQIASFIANGEHELSETRRSAQKTLELARWLEKHCKTRPDTKINEASIVELTSLVKLHQFYSMAAHDPHDALAIMSELNLVPLINDELPGRVASFVLQPEHVSKLSLLKHFCSTRFVGQKRAARRDRDADGGARRALQRSNDATAKKAALPIVLKRRPTLCCAN